MSAQRTRSDALAEALREAPPVLDDLSRARLERRVLEGLSATPRASIPRRLPVRAVLVVGLAAAAAVGLFVYYGRDPGPPLARFERREATSIQRGTLEEGSTVRTGADETAEIEVSSARVRIAGASRARLTTVSRERLSLELVEGSIEVAFHPLEHGREHLSVETAAARVEVVGTVFRVVVREGATAVSVSEGTVRVVPLDGSAVRLVRAGEETTVRPGLRAERGAEEALVTPIALAERSAPEPESTDDEPQAAPGAVASDEPSEASAPARDVSAPAEDPPAEDPAALLGRANALIDRGRASAAIPALRQLTRSPDAPVDVRTEAWLRLADVHEGAGRFAQARDAYERAAETGRGRPRGHLALAYLARLFDRRLGDRVAARATYERYLEEAPDGANASQARSALCRLGASEHCP